MIEISVVFAIVLEHLRSSVIMEEVDPNNRQQKRKFPSVRYIAIYYKYGRRQSAYVHTKVWRFKVTGRRREKKEGTQYSAASI